MSHHTKSRNGHSGYKYSLKRPTSETPTSILLRTSFFQIPFKYGIGYSIYPELWDNEAYRPTTDKTILKKYRNINPYIDNEISDIKTRIEKIENAIDEYIRPIMRGANTFDIRDLKSILDTDVKKVKIAATEEKTPFLLPFLEQLIKEMETGKEKYKNRTGLKVNYKESTIQTYRSLKKHILAFQKDISKKVRFEDIDMDVYEQFIDYFQRNDININTIGKNIAKLKSTMTIALDRGLHHNRIHQNKSFIAPSVEVDSIALDKYDMQRLEKLSFPDKPHFQKALDIFLCGCYSAQRISDYKRINPKHQKTITTYSGEEIQCLEMITQKTGKKVIIPIQPKLMAILNKYNYKLPHIADQKLNEYIKEIAKKGKLIEMVSITDHAKGIIKKHPKYSLISSHTARRTAITTMYHTGIPTQYIMSISGHTTEKAFKKYLKITEETAATKIAEMPYFKGKESKIVKMKS